MATIKQLLIVFKFELVAFFDNIDLGDIVNNVQVEYELLSLAIYFRPCKFEDAVRLPLRELIRSGIVKDKHISDQLDQMYEDDKDLWAIIIVTDREEDKNVE